MRIPPNSFTISFILKNLLCTSQEVNFVKIQTDKIMASGKKLAKMRSFGRHAKNRRCKAFPSRAKIIAEEIEKARPPKVRRITKEEKLRRSLTASETDNLID